MKVLVNIVKRNTKLFFKDRGMFFSSMITPLILMMLYVTFLANVYRDSFNAAVPEGIEVSKKMIEGFVGGWLFSSLLAVCCVTISFCSNLLMIQDKALGVISDFRVSPIKKSILSLGYFISSCLVTMIICYIAFACGLVYLACVGWYLRFVDILLIIVDIFILILFGTALSSIVNYFLSTQGQMSAIGTVVSSVYGFICGAYMPISQFGSFLQKILMFLPGTYATGLLHQHFMNGVLNKFGESFPAEVVSNMKSNFDIDLKFFGHIVPSYASYLIIGLTTIALIIIYVLMNIYGKRRKSER